MDHYYRNHPYFFNQRPNTSTQAVTYPSAVANPAAVDNTYPGYEPRMVNLQAPRWFNNQNFVRNIGSITKHTGYVSANDGYRIDGDGYIYQPSTDKDANGGVIAAMAIATEIENPHNMITGRTHIINTEDAGFRHIHINNDGSVMDIGPVESACIFGNIDRPEGIYVPLCNTRAMVDAAVLLDAVIKQSIENDSDIPLVENESSLEDLPVAPFEEDHHKCTCGGNCKCKK